MKFNLVDRYIEKRQKRKENTLVSTIASFKLLRHTKMESLLYSKKKAVQKSHIYFQSREKEKEKKKSRKNLFKYQFDMMNFLGFRYIRYLI